MTYTPPPTPRRCSVPLPACEEAEVARPSRASASAAQLARLEINFVPLRNLSERTGIKLRVDVEPLNRKKLRRASSPLRPSKNPLLLLFDVDEGLQAITLHDKAKPANPAQTKSSDTTAYKDTSSLSPLDRILYRRRGLTVTLGVSQVAPHQPRLHGVLSPGNGTGHGLEQCQCDGISA